MVEDFDHPNEYHYFEGGHQKDSGQMQVRIGQYEVTQCHNISGVKKSVSCLTYHLFHINLQLCFGEKMYINISHSLSEIFMR